MAGGAWADILTDAEYDRMLGLLNAYGKGRVFLAEFARQSRAEDTRALFGALAAIESSLATVREQLRPEAVAAEIRRIVAALRDELERTGADGPDRHARQTAAMLKACSELTSLAEALSRGALPGTLPQAPQPGAAQAPARTG